MLVAGSHVPIGNRALRKAFSRGLILAVGTGIVAVPIGAALSSMAHTHHTALYAVLLASSSAAVIMPIVDGEGLAGDRVLTLMAQVAIADTACIIALPLAADPSKAGRAAVGAVIVLAVAGLAYLVLRELADRNLITRLQAVSVQHNFGLEMRVSLAALFALAGLAVNVHVSVMLAGFAFGLVLSAIGTPRRLASQLFAVTEGFLGPVFFIWLGASIDLRALAHHPRLIVLALGSRGGNHRPSRSRATPRSAVAARRTGQRATRRPCRRSSPGCARRAAAAWRRRRDSGSRGVDPRCCIGGRRLCKADG